MPILPIVDSLPFAARRAVQPQASVQCVRGLYGTGILFEEPNPTGSRPRDLIGLYRQHTKPHPPNTQGRARREHGGEQGHVLKHRVASNSITGRARSTRTISVCKGSRMSSFLNSPKLSPSHFKDMHRILCTCRAFIKHSCGHLRDAAADIRRTSASLEGAQAQQGKDGRR